MQSIGDYLVILEKFRWAITILKTRFKGTKICWNQLIGIIDLWGQRQNGVNAKVRSKIIGFKPTLVGEGGSVGT